MKKVAISAKQGLEEKLSELESLLVQEKYIVKNYGTGAENQTKCAMQQEKFDLTLVVCNSGNSSTAVVSQVKMPDWIIAEGQIKSLDQTENLWTLGFGIFSPEKIVELTNQFFENTNKSD